MLEGVRRVHLIGIGGIGVSGVARALMALGFEVSGSDVRESQITEALRREGADVAIGHDPRHIAGVDLVVHSTAIPDTNPELVAAREGGVSIRHRAELLGAVLERHALSVGVIGTHGKGTVSSALSWILEAAGRNPGFVIGGMLENFAKANSRVTGRELVVAEVDESDGSLRHVHPNIVVINNLEADHLNYYDSLEHIQDTVVESLNANEGLRHVIVNADDPGARAIIARLRVPVTTFGHGEDADLRGTDVETMPMSSRLQMTYRGTALGTVEMGQPGLYNVDNALAATAAALVLDVPFEHVSAALPAFRGLENRFTVVDVDDRRIIKDYTSHPTGIRRVLEAAKADGRPITAVFKPYRFTMIHYLLDDYAEAFHDAHETVITKLYTAGEVPIAGIDTEVLCQKIRDEGPEVTYIEVLDDILPYIQRTVPPNGQVLFFGGDDLFRLADRYVGELGGGAA